MISRAPVEYPIGELSSKTTSTVTRPWIDWLRDFVRTLNGALPYAVPIAVGGVYVETTNTDPSTTLGYGTWTSESTLIGATTFYLWVRLT